MKKQQNDNIKSKVIFISLGLISTFLLVINFIPIFVVNAGITSEYTGDLDPDRIAYVNQSKPDMNYNYVIYSVGYSVIGNFSDTFIHFDLDLLPKTTEKLYFIIRDYYDSFYESPLEDIEINLISVGSNWNSSEITWNNSPKHEEIIDTVNASEIRQGAYPEYYNLEKSIDITELFNTTQLDEISFCINITENNVELNTSIFLRGIKLVWNYEQLIISYTPIISSVIIFSMLIGTVIYIRKDVHSCPECDNKRKITEKLCSSCGANFEDDLIIRGSEYQWLLILILVLALFEVIYIYTYSFTHIFFVMPVIIPLLLTLWVILCAILIIRKIKRDRELRLSLR